MRSRLATRVLAVLAAPLLALGFAAVSTQPASAYPATVCSVAVHPDPVRGGHPVTVTGKANKVVDWTVVFGPRALVDGDARAESGGLQTATGHGKTFKHVFSTPKVDVDTQFAAKVTCVGGRTIVSVVTVSASNGNGNGNGNGDGNGSGLPGTGGPSLWIAVLALALVAEGSRRVFRSRGAHAR